MSDIDEGVEPEVETVEPEEGAEPEPAEELEEGTEPEPAEEPEEGAEPEPAQPRRESRVQRLANEARREREQRIALEAELRATREARQQPQDDGQAARVRAEKLALMEPAERREFERDEELARLRQGQQITQIQIADFADRTAFEAKAAVNPIYAKHKEWVETTLAAERRAGRNPSREVLLKYKIGEDALSAKPTKKSVAAKAAAGERVATAKGAPTSARSDAAGKKVGKGDSLEELEARLRDVQL